MKAKQLYITMLMTAMIAIAVFSFPQRTHASCNFLNFGCKVNEWIAEGVNSSTNAGMQWIRSEIIKPDSTYVAPSTIRWLIITRIAGWSLFGLMMAARMGFNLAHPFFTGRLHFDEGSYWLTALGSCVVILSGDQFITMTRDYAASFSQYFGTVDFIWPISTNDFENESYATLGVLLLALLCILWVILYALYLFRDMMLNFLTTATPIVGGTIVFTDKFFRLWWQFVATFILMKPIHAWGISYMIDYLADTSSGLDPIGKTLIAIFFFGIILALPIMIMGNSVRSTIRLMKDGGI